MREMNTTFVFSYLIKVIALVAMVSLYQRSFANAKVSREYFGYPYSAEDNMVPKRHPRLAWNNRGGVLAKRNIEKNTKEDASLRTNFPAFTISKSPYFVRRPGIRNSFAERDVPFEDPHLQSSFENGEFGRYGECSFFWEFFSSIIKDKGGNAENEHIQ